MSSREKRVPEVRFRGYSDDWEQRKFSSIVNRASKQSNDPNLPRVEFEDIVSGEGRLNKDVSQKLDNRKGIVFKPNFILFGKLRPYLKNWLFTNFRGIALGDFWVFEPNNSSSIFNYYLIQTDKYQIVANLSMGTKMPRSDWKTVSETEFRVPTIEEQNKIGNLFKQLDDTIALHQRKLDKLKQLKIGFMQVMFPQKGENLPRVRFADFDDSWEQRTLKDNVDLLKDGTHGTHKDGKDAFLLSAKNIKNGQLIINEFIDRKIPSDDYDSIFRNYKLMDQDLLVTTVGTIGQTALYIENDTKLAFQRSIAIIRGNKNMNQNFLKSIVDSSYVQKQLKQSASMSAQAGVYLGDLEKLIINTPKLLEQIIIGNFFKQLDSTIALHQMKMEKLETLKKAYLQKMFT